MAVEVFSLRRFLGWSCSLSFSLGWHTASIAPGSMGVRRSGDCGQKTGRRQIIHDRAQSGVGFGLQAAVPGSSDKVMNLVITCAPQRPYQDFRLV
jgi:hypothetical protein